MMASPRLTAALKWVLQSALLWLLSGLGVSALAAPLVLQPTMDGVESSPYLTVLEDKGRNLSLKEVEQASRHGNFAPLRNGITTRGSSASAWWVRLVVHNPHTTPLSWIAEFTYPFTDFVDAYRRTADGTVEQVNSGDHQSGQGDPLGIAGIELSFSTAPGASDTIYFRLRFQREGIVDFHHLIWTPEPFARHQQLLVGLYGVVLGIGGTLLLYNLILFLSIRAPEYGWYLLYLASAIAMFFAQSGLGNRYLWPEWPTLKDAMPIVAAQALFLFGVQFTRAFLDTRRWVPRVDRLLLGMLLLDALSLALFLAGMRSAAIELVFVLGLLFGLFPLLGAWLWSQGHKVARSYTLAWTLLTVLTATTVLRLMGGLPAIPSLNWMARVGYIMEGLLLSLALADRIRLLKAQKESAEEEQQRASEEALVQLEREVAMRTVELVEARRIADEQARTDSLSGLPNRRAFFELAKQELKRAKRYASPLSVIMLDIDHFKQINDNYGHAAGDAVICKLAQAIREVLRDTDVAARIGGEEFALLLPETTLAGAKIVAERLRSRIATPPIQVEQQELAVTASFGVVTCCAAEESVDDLLAAADRLLYEAKGAGRNCVISAPEELAAAPA
jgi:diguanylate cyclase (GGDEF)-like protein